LAENAKTGPGPTREKLCEELKDINIELKALALFFIAGQPSNFVTSSYALEGKVVTATANYCYLVVRSDF